MKSVILALALPALALTGCASGGYYGYNGAYYGPDYYPGYYGGTTVDIGYYGNDRGGYYHHDRDYHNDSGARTAVAMRSSGGYHAGTRVASSGGSHYSGHASGGSHTASASASVGHGGGGGR